MKRFSLILILCVFAMVAMAQKTLSGTILSKTDGRPIEMATVRLFAYQDGDSTCKVRRPITMVYLF